jgi:hypothetical protein
MKQIKSATLALMLVVSATLPTFAADSEYILTNDWPIQNAQSTGGINGRLWVGNFGSNGGSLLSKSEVNSSDWFTLFSKFRPNTSFGLTGGLLDELTLGEKTGVFDIGTGIGYDDENGNPQGYTPDRDSQFAGQDLYLFAINSAAVSWNSTLLGSEYQVLLLGMASGFGDGASSTGRLAYDISGGVNDVVIGSGGPTSVQTATVPEPATGSLLLLGLATALAVRRRKV